MASEARRQRLSFEDYLALMADLASQGNGFQDFWFGPAGPQWTPDDLMTRIACEAERCDTRIQTHALESHYESLESHRTRGLSVLDHLDSLGVLTGRLSLAHAVWVTEEDIDLLAKRGTRVSHNPGSNLRLRSGIAPVAAMVQAGVTTALGTDGTTLAGDEDIFAEMRLALNLNRPPHASAPALVARDVLAMATEHGADLLGRGDELGQLRPGFRADAVVLDLSRLLSPWTDPAADPIELIVGRAKASDVRDVLVEGQVVLRNSLVTGLDEEGLLDELRGELAVMSPDHQARVLQSELRGYLLRWYLRWDARASETHPPVMRYGARPLPNGRDSK